MSWILLSLASALFLGVYDLFKKTSVRDNAVPPVLLCSCSVGAAIWAPFVLLSRFQPTVVPSEFLYVAQLTAIEHGFLFAKSVLVGASWTFAFFALKHLPVTIATPIRATSPLWTILIAVLFMGERPGRLQWLGVFVILSSFFAFSIIGKLDGIDFRRDRSVGFMVVATLFAACSALYDKYLLQRLDLEVAAVQAWFSIYLVPVVLPMFIHWYRRQRHESVFQWRWTIPLIAISLLIADYLYFTAIGIEGAMISLISPARRVSIIVAFIGGFLIFQERNLRPKAICTAMMLAGIVLLAM